MATAYTLKIKIQKPNRIIIPLLHFLLIICFFSIAQSEATDQKPRHIISQTLASDEILLAICPVERIVAVSTFALDPQYSNVIEDARRVGRQINTNVEHLLTLNPDLIIVASYSRAETVRLLKTTGIPVLRLKHFRNLKDIQQNIKMIGQATGLETKARALIAQFQQQIATIQARLPTTDVIPRVVFLNQWFYTAGRLTTIDDLFRLVNAVNIPAQQGIQGYVKINPEQLIAWQPDFIISEASQNNFAQTHQRLLDHPAVRTSIANEPTRIILIDTRHLSAVSHHIIQALNVLADKLYP